MPKKLIFHRIFNTVSLRTETRVGNFSIAEKIRIGFRIGACFQTTNTWKYKFRAVSSIPAKIPFLFGNQNALFLFIVYTHTFLCYKYFNQIAWEVQEYEPFNTQDNSGVQGQLFEKTK